MNNLSTTLQPDGKIWTLALQDATIQGVKVVPRMLEVAGLERSEKLESQMQSLLGSAAAKTLVPKVLTSRAGRSVMLSDRRHRFLSINWRGRVDGEGLASLILSNYSRRP